MRVVIIGAGNVASVLGRKIKRAGHDVIQVLSRRYDSAKVLADELGSAASNNFGEIDKTGELFLVAMSDAALNELKEKINVGDKIVVHTAGSVCKDVLKDVSIKLWCYLSLTKPAKRKHGRINSDSIVDRCF